MTSIILFINQKYYVYAGEYDDEIDLRKRKMDECEVIKEMHELEIESCEIIRRKLRNPEVVANTVTAMNADTTIPGKVLLEAESAVVKANLSDETDKDLWYHPSIRSDAPDPGDLRWKSCSQCGSVDILVTDPHEEYEYYYCKRCEVYFGRKKVNSDE